MQFSEVVSVFVVPDEHRSRAVKAAHQAIDNLVIEGVPVSGAKVRVNRICDPETLDQLVTELSER